MWVYYEVLNVDEMSLVRYNRCMLYVWLCDVFLVFWGWSMWISFISLDWNLFLMCENKIVVMYMWMFISN